MAGVKVENKAGDSLEPVDRLRHKRFCSRARNLNMALVNFYLGDPDKLGRCAPFRAEGKADAAAAKIRRSAMPMTSWTRASFGSMSGISMATSSRLPCRPRGSAMIRPAASASATMPPIRLPQSIVATRSLRRIPRPSAAAGRVILISA